MQKCNYYAGPFCSPKSYDKVDEDTLKAYISYLELTNPTIKFDTSDCVKEIYYHKYWLGLEYLAAMDPTFGILMFLLVPILVVLIITIPLIIINCNCKCKKEDKDLMMSEKE